MIVNMNFQNHGCNVLEYIYINTNFQQQGFLSMRQTRNSIPKVKNDVDHTYSGHSDNSTQLCTVQFTNKYWLGTEVNTYLFFSVGKKVGKKVKAKRVKFNS